MNSKPVIACISSAFLSIFLIMGCSSPPSPPSQTDSINIEGFWRHESKDGRYLVLEGYIDAAGNQKFRYLQQYYSYKPILDFAEYSDKHWKVAFRMETYDGKTTSDYRVEYIITRENDDLIADHAESWSESRRALLIEWPPSRDERNSQGDDAAHQLARSHGTDKIRAFEILSQHGFSFETQNDSGETPLHIVCLRGDPDAVSFLLKKGVNPQLENASGETPLDIAIKERKRIEEGEKAHLDWAKRKIGDYGKIEDTLTK